MLHPLGFDHQIVQPTASHYTDYARGLGRGEIEFTKKILACNFTYENRTKK